MARMRKLTVLAGPVWGFRGPPAGEWGGDATQERQLVAGRDMDGVRRHLFGGGGGPAEAAAEAKQERTWLPSSALRRHTILGERVIRAVRFATVAATAARL
jgi:hypothetical protein